MKASSVALAALLALILAAPALAKAPHLSYSAAKRVIHRKANHVAKQQTRITSLYRINGTYYGRAEWSRINPHGCHGCGFNPITGELEDTAETESCAVEIVANRRSSGRVVTGIERFSCY